MEIRCRIILELVAHSELYISLPYLRKGTDLPAHENLLNNYAMFSEQYTPGESLTSNVIRRIFKSEILSITGKNSYMGIWQLFGLSSVLQCKLFLVYPNLGPDICDNTLHRLILSRQDKEINHIASIMWSSTRQDMEAMNWRPNHFVTLIPATKEVVYVTEEDIGLPLYSSDDSFEGIDAYTVNTLLDSLFNE